MAKSRYLEDKGGTGGGATPTFDNVSITVDNQTGSNGTGITAPPDTSSNPAPNVGDVIKVVYDDVTLYFTAVTEGTWTGATVQEIPLYTPDFDNISLTVDDQTGNNGAGIAAPPITTSNPTPNVSDVLKVVYDDVTLYFTAVTEGTWTGATVQEIPLHQVDLVALDHDEVFRAYATEENSAGQAAGTAIFRIENPKVLSDYSNTISYDSATGRISVLKASTVDLEITFNFFTSGTRVSGNRFTRIRDKNNGNALVGGLGRFGQDSSLSVAARIIVAAGDTGVWDLVSLSSAGNQKLQKGSFISVRRYRDEQALSANEIFRVYAYGGNIEGQTAGVDLFRIQNAKVISDASDTFSYDQNGTLSILKPVAYPLEINFHFRTSGTGASGERYTRIRDKNNSNAFVGDIGIFGQSSTANKPARLVVPADTVGSWDLTTLSSANNQKLLAGSFVSVARLDDCDLAMQLSGWDQNPNVAIVTEISNGRIGAKIQHDYNNFAFIYSESASRDDRQTIKFTFKRDTSHTENVLLRKNVSPGNNVEVRINLNTGAHSAIPFGGLTPIVESVYFDDFIVQAIVTWPAFAWNNLQIVTSQNGAKQDLVLYDLDLDHALVLDEDDMVSDSDTATATQQSLAAYVNRRDLFLANIGTHKSGGRLSREAGKTFNISAVTFSRWDSAAHDAEFFSYPAIVGASFRYYDRNGILNTGFDASDISTPQTQVQQGVGWDNNGTLASITAVAGDLNDGANYFVYMFPDSGDVAVLIPQMVTNTVNNAFMRINHEYSRIVLPTALDSAVFMGALTVDEDAANWVFSLSSGAWGDI